MKKFYTIIISLMVFFPATVSGQTLLTSYFVDNSTMSHTLNPAFAPAYGYIGIPAISSINLNLESNVGLSQFLYPLDNGSLGTFLHPDVSAEQFLSTLPSITYLNPDINLDLINVGFKTGKSSFWTIGLTARINVDSSIPDELFKFLKVGMNSDPTSYSIKNLAFVQDAFAQLSIGYSQQVIKGLRVGAKLKFLTPVDRAYVSIDELNINMSSEKWDVTSAANAYILGKGVDFVKNEEGRITSLKINKNDLGIAGFGAAVDLGVQYRIDLGTPVDGLTFSLSATDVGFMTYPQGAIKMTEVADGRMSFSGFDNIDVKNLNLKEQFDALLQEMFTLINFKEVAATSGKTEALSAKVFCGVEYPFLKNDKGRDLMSVGLLYSGRFGKIRNHHELTLSYNYQPVDWFDVSLSYSFLNYGRTFGWLLNFAPRRGVNFFIGSDYMCFTFTPQGIPANRAYFNVQTGISVPFGK